MAEILSLPKNFSSLGTLRYLLCMCNYCSEHTNYLNGIWYVQLLCRLPIAQTAGKFVEKYLTQVRSIRDLASPALSLEASLV